MIVNRNVSKHYAEKTINAVLAIISGPVPIRQNVNIKIKTFFELERDRKEMKVEKKITWREDRKLYKDELNLKNTYLEKKEAREFHNKQVNGTMFDCSNYEGELL